MVSWLTLVDQSEPVAHPYVAAVEEAAEGEEEEEKEEATGGKRKRKHSEEEATGGDGSGGDCSSGGGATCGGSTGVAVGAANCQIVETRGAGGWPHVFVATVAPLAPGDELLMRYGAGYWRHHTRRRRAGDAIRERVLK